MNEIISIDPSSLKDSNDDEWEQMSKNVKNWNCNKIRTKIQLFLATKEMTQTKFLSEIGRVNSNSFQRFMKLKGPHAGIDNGTYQGAVTFFNMRERVQKETQASLTSEEKKRKRDEDSVEKSSKKSSLSDIVQSIQDVTLPNTIVRENSSLLVHGDFPVYDTCDEVRKKALEFIANNGSTASFLKIIGVNPKSWKSFMEFRGGGETVYFQPGAGNSAYPKAYEFFEKLRIKRNEPKSHKRIQFEEKFPNGYSLKHDSGHRWVFSG